MNGKGVKCRLFISSGEDDQRINGFLERVEFVSAVATVVLIPGGEGVARYLYIFYKEIGLKT